MCIALPTNGRRANRDRLLIDVVWVVCASIGVMAGVGFLGFCWIIRRGCRLAYDSCMACMRCVERRCGLAYLAMHCLLHSNSIGHVTRAAKVIQRPQLALNPTQATIPYNSRPFVLSIHRFTKAQFVPHKPFKRSSTTTSPTPSPAVPGA